MQPIVSIILPVYNGARFIEKAITSVLAQSYTDWELLIIDDGSTDTTSEIVAPYTQKDSRVLYIKNDQNLGIQKTLNKGIEKAQGKYIARIDADDAWIDAEKLVSQVSFLESNSEYVLVGTGVVVVNTEGKELYRFLLPQSDAQIRNKLLFKNCFTHSSVLFRKDAVTRVGGYSEDPQVRHIEDYDLWLKLGASGKLSNLPVYGVGFMVHDDSISAKNKIAQFKQVSVLIRKYKDAYPRYVLAQVFSCFRTISYTLFSFLVPKAVIHAFISLYKR